MMIFYRGVKLSNPILAHHGAGISKPTKLPKSHKNHPVKCNFLYTSTMVSFYMGISLGSDHHSRSESLVSKLLNTAHYWQNMLIWLVLWNMTFMTFHILGMSSSQLTFIFFGGGETTNQLFSELGTSYIHASWFIFFHVGLNI